MEQRKKKEWAQQRKRGKKEEKEILLLPEGPVDHFEDLQAGHVLPQGIQEAEQALVCCGTGTEKQP